MKRVGVPLPPDPFSFFRTNSSRSSDYQRPDSTCRNKISSLRLQTQTKVGKTTVKEIAIRILDNRLQEKDSTFFGLRLGTCGPKEQ